MEQMEVVKGLEPKGVWDIFARMAATPRPSKKEERVRAVLEGVAKDAGFETDHDPIGNLIVRVPAKPGCEGAPTTIIQGHIDMVCEKNEATKHDFDNDPIRLQLETAADGRKFVTADGTTLGADNGIGVAMGYAAALDPEVKHGPLELLMTIDEEAGMTGAKNLDKSYLKGRLMINLDSEEDHALFVGCAGGCDVNLVWDFPATATPANGVALKVVMRGLRGGHSGIDIHENRANALKILAGLLDQAGGEGLVIAGGKGGSLRNAIPREANLIVVGDAGLRGRLEEAAPCFVELARKTMKDTGAEFVFEEVERPAKGLAADDSRRLLRALRALPSGVQAVVPEIAGQIMSSNNMATLDFDEKGDRIEAHVCCLSRSSDRNHLHNVVAQIRAVGELSGAQVTDGNEYPGWQPNMDSDLLARTRRLYEKTFGNAPAILAIHAGLECGILNERMDGELDMVSFGPTIQGAHSPDEKVWVDSVEKIWVLFKGLLGEIAGA